MKDKSQFFKYLAIVAMFVTLAHMTYRLHEIEKQVEQVEQKGCPVRK